MEVKKEDVRHIATLAKIALEDEARFQNDLNRILKMVEEMSEVDISDVDPVASVLDVSPNPREDKIDHEINKDDIFANAPGDVTAGFFSVPKVLSEE